MATALNLLAYKSYQGQQARFLITLGPIAFVLRQTSLLPRVVLPSSSFLSARRKSPPETPTSITYPPHKMPQTPPPDSLIFDTYLEQHAPEVIVTLRKFTVSKFYLLYVEDMLVGQWTCGHGKKSNTMAVEAFLWTLCVFKHYATCNNYALDFGFKLPTSEQLVHRVMDICKPVLRQPFDISLSMRDQPSNGRVIANNPYALYAADVKFQFALRLSRRFEEARRYISNKHKLYDYKTEASMNPHGGAIFVTVENQATCPNYMAGAVSDITFLSNRVAEKTSQ